MNDLPPGQTAKARDTVKRIEKTDSDIIKQETRAMATKPKFSLKKKLALLIISIIITLSILAGLFSFKGISDITSDTYLSRSKEISATVAAVVDAEMVKSIRDRVMAVFNATEDRVSTEDWGSPEFEAYLDRYSEIEDSDEYRTVQKQLRLVQDNNHIKCAYLLWFDLKTESTIYLVDGSYGDEYSGPGAFDAVMYDVDREAMRNPANGVAPDITNTEEYGWVVAAGSPIFLNGELLAFAGAEISMNAVMAQRNQFLFFVYFSLLMLAIVFIILSMILIDRTIIQPINKLSDTSEKYWIGESTSIRNEFSQLQIHTGDEIETLSNAMKQMEENINEQFTRILDTTQKLITTQEHAAEMDRIANIDALTKVRNKRAYDEKVIHLNEEIRKGERTDFGIAMIDLNNLKPINDTYGHDKGNVAIQKLCGMVCSTFKHSAVFRIGGDEFAALLEGEDLENAENLIHDLVRKWEQNQNDTSLQPWEQTSAAIGYSRYQKGDTVEEVFKRADDAMYEQKTRMKAARKQQVR